MNETLKKLGIISKHVYIDTFDNEWRVYVDNDTDGTLVVSMEWESVVAEYKAGKVCIVADPDDAEHTAFREISRVLERLYNGLSKQ